MTDATGLKRYRFHTIGKPPLGDMAECVDGEWLKCADVDPLLEGAENLQHQIQQRGGMAEIDDARMKAQLYDQQQTLLDEAARALREAAVIVNQLPTFNMRDVERFKDQAQAVLAKVEGKS